jgi:hypothetical protein
MMQIVTGIPPSFIHSFMHISNSVPYSLHAIFTPICALHERGASQIQKREDQGRTLHSMMQLLMMHLLIGSFHYATFSLVACMEILSIPNIGCHSIDSHNHLCDLTLPHLT